MYVYVLKNLPADERPQLPTATSILYTDAIYYISYTYIYIYTYPRSLIYNPTPPKVPSRTNKQNHTVYKYFFFEFYSSSVFFLPYNHRLILPLFNYPLSTLAKVMHDLLNWNLYRIDRYVSLVLNPNRRSLVDRMSTSISLYFINGCIYIYGSHIH